MNQKEIDVNMMEEKLKAFKQQIYDSFQIHSYDFVAQTCKQVSYRLIYFIKLSTFQLRNSLKGLKNLLNEVLKIVSAFIKSTQYHKFGHKLPLFKFVETKFDMLLNQKPQQFDKQMLYQRVQRNQGSASYLQWNKYQITNTQKKFLHSPHFHQLMTALPNNQIKFQNPQCVCCSQVFIKNMPIYNRNPIFNVMVELSAQKGFDIPILQKHLNSICNKGGGVVIIGAKKQEETFFATGISFKSEEQITIKIKEILNLFEKLRPICRTFLVESVRVHSNYAESLTPEQIAKQYARVCFRIIVVPTSDSKVSYLQFQNKVKEYTYEVNKYNKAMDPIKIPSQVKDNQYQSLYTFMHYKFKKCLPKEINSHKNIFCLRPHPYYSKVYIDSSYRGDFNNINFSNIIEQQKDKSTGKEGLFSDTPKFKYHWTSLLVVNSQKNDRYIKTFVQSLHQKKQLVQLVKPYDQTFKQGNGIRCVYMLSHQMPVNELRNRLRSQETKKNVKQGSVKIMPVFQNIQIDRSKLSSFNEEVVKKKFMDRFNSSFSVQESYREDQNGQSVPILHMNFTDFTESIYAYMILEELGCIFGYFTQEGVTYVKKTK